MFSEIKQKNSSFHLNTTRLLQYHRKQGEIRDTSRDEQMFCKIHNDSAIKGVLVAMDYDTNLMNLLYHETDKH